MPHQAVSFTGGEPLLHGPFIRALAEQLDAPIFLETNGTLYQQLEEILDIVDIISMDIKLPSIIRTPQWEAHKAFLRLAREKDLYVKLVSLKRRATRNSARPYSSWRKSRRKPCSSSSRSRRTAAARQLPPGRSSRIKPMHSSISGMSASSRRRTR